MKNLLACFVLVAGCYNPNVPDGQLQCELGDHACPSGYTCAGNLFCYHSGTLSSSLFGTGELGPLDLSAKQGDVTFNTETGEVLLAGMSVPLVVKNASGFQHIQQHTDGPLLAIWNFSSVNIPALVNVNPTSSSGSVLMIASTGALIVKGNIGVSEDGAFGGIAGLPGKPSPGAATNTVGQSATPMTSGGGGGGAGGTILVIGRDQLKLDANHGFSAVGGLGGAGVNSGGFGGGGGDGRIALQGPLSGSPVMALPAPNRDPPPQTFPR